MSAFQIDRLPPLANVPALPSAAKSGKTAMRRCSKLLWTLVTTTTTNTIIIIYQLNDYYYVIALNHSLTECGYNIL